MNHPLRVRRPHPISSLLVPAEQLNEQLNSLLFNRKELSERVNFCFFLGGGGGHLCKSLHLFLS